MPYSIKAKPRIFEGVRYKTQTEAKWAIYFFNHNDCESYEYEPKTFRNKETGWKYTPDFLVEFSEYYLFVEVKPKKPSRSYITNLMKLVNQNPVLQSLLIVEGDFYKGIQPKVYIAENRYSNPRKLIESFLWDNDAFHKASTYRFDIE